MSAEHYPQVEDDDALYTEYETRWSRQKVAPTNFADFFEIKYGLRRATFSKPHKPDLAMWIRTIGSFLTDAVPSSLRRRAIYEICVAALRGQNNLDPHSALVKEYFANLDGLNLEALRDATTLLSYCSHAQIYGQFQIDPKLLYEYTSKLVAALKDALNTARGPGAECLLLQTLGQAALLPFHQGVTPHIDMRDTFRYWLLLAKKVDKAPLFPLEDFADLLTIMTPVAGKDSKFQALTGRVDELLSKRTSGFVAAKKCRDRAMKYLEADQYIPAIKQFHSARVKWFTAETLKDSVLSMMTLARCYQELGLSFAGAYYALGAALITFRSEDETVKRLFPATVFLAADCYYGAGATLTYLQLMQAALFAHGGYTKNPGDLEAHEDLQRAFAHYAIIRGVAERLQPDLVPIVDQRVDHWPIANEFKEEVREWSSKPDLWTKTESEPEIWRRAQEDLVDRPFSDVGKLRRIEWQALGLKWIVEHANTFDDTLIGEEFAATCQIIAGDLADTDLCLLPMTVHVSVSLRKGVSCHIEECPNNRVACMHVRFPIAWVASSKHFMDLRGEIVAIASAVLHQCSGLSDQKYLGAIEKAFKGGLAGKAFSVRPYAELYAELISRAMFNEVDRASLRPPRESEAFEHPAHKELAAPTTTGPGYTRKRSNEFIANRYRRAIRPIRLTVPSLMKDALFREQIRKMLAKGYKDWHVLVIVVNIAIQYRTEKKVGIGASHKMLTKAMEDEMNREERNDDIEIPASLFNDERMAIQDNIMWLTAAKTWGLALRGQTPNFGAYENLLVSRYRMLDDDIPHEELFPGV